MEQIMKKNYLAFLKNSPYLLNDPYIHIYIECIDRQREKEGERENLKNFLSYLKFHNIYIYIYIYGCVSCVIVTVQKIE